MARLQFTQFKIALLLAAALFTSAITSVTPVFAATVNYTIDFGNPAVTGSFSYDQDSQAVTALLVHYAGYSFDMTHPPAAWGSGSIGHPWIQNDYSGLFTLGPDFAFEFLSKSLPGTHVPGTPAGDYLGYHWSVGYQTLGSDGRGYYGPLSWFQIVAANSTASARAIAVIDTNVPDAWGSWAIAISQQAPVSNPEPEAFWIFAALAALVSARLLRQRYLNRLRHEHDVA